MPIRDALVAVATTDTHPILPITVAYERGVYHFYTELGGYHMSAGFNSDTIYLAFHEGKFDKIMKVAGYPEIHFNQRDHNTIQVKSCTKFPDNALSSLFHPSMKSTIPVGIISWKYPLESRFGYIKSFEITLTACNELTVCFRAGSSLHDFVEGMAKFNEGFKPIN